MKIVDKTIGHRYIDEDGTIFEIIKVIPNGGNRDVLLKCIEGPSRSWEVGQVISDDGMWSLDVWTLIENKQGNFKSLYDKLSSK